MDLKFSWSTILLMIPVVLMGNYAAVQSTTNELICPGGWTRRKDTCYQMQSTTILRTYQEARHDCQALGGDLPIPALRMEVEFITYLALSNFTTRHDNLFVWIGCTDETVEGVYRCVDDSVMPFTGWNTGQPDNRDGEDGVMLLVPPAVIHDLRFNDLRWLVCESKDPICRTGWTRHGTKCYLMTSNTTKTTYHEGRRTCQLAGGDLPIIASREEAEFLIFFTMSHFVTVSDPPFEAYIWIGCTSQENEGVWTCVDSSPMKFVDWDDGQPSNRSDEPAIGLKLKRGLIHDTYLTADLWVVCEHALIRAGTCTLPHAPSSSHFENPRALYEQGQSVTVTCDYSSSSTSWQCGATGNWIRQDISCNTRDTTSHHHGVSHVVYIIIVPAPFALFFGILRYYRLRRNPRPMRRPLGSTTSGAAVGYTRHHSGGEGQLNAGSPPCGTHQPGEGITNPGYSPPVQCGPLSKIPQPTTGGPPGITTPTAPPPPYDNVN